MSTNWFVFYKVETEETFALELLVVLELFVDNVIG